MAELGMWKPVLTVLVMPPVPMLVLMVWAGWRLRRGLNGGWTALWLAVLGLWLSSCAGTALWLQNHVLKVPAPLNEAQRRELAERGRAAPLAPAGRQRAVAGMRAADRSPPVAIIVLGGGLEPYAPEYGVSSLSTFSLERLRYGAWLAKLTGLPLGFSGGVGWAQKGGEVGATEAEIAERVARQDFGLSLRWVESRSSDTADNAAATVNLLADQGVQEVVVVTHACHEPRAMRLFELAAARRAQTHPSEPKLRVTAAGLGYWQPEMRAALAWLPSRHGASNVALAWHEVIGGLLAH